MILPLGGPLNVFFTLLLLPFIIAWSLFYDGVVEPILRRLRRVRIVIAPVEGNHENDESL